MFRRKQGSYIDQGKTEFQWPTNSKLRTAPVSI
jgi:hypothetical protein